MGVSEINEINTFAVGNYPYLYLFLLHSAPFEFDPVFDLTLFFLAFYSSHSDL